MTFRDWLEKKVSQGFEPDTSAPVGSSDNPSNRILTVANAFTIMRMLLTCLFLVLFIQGICRPLAIATYAVAEASAAPKAVRRRAVNRRDLAPLVKIFSVRSVQRQKHTVQLEKFK